MRFAPALRSPVIEPVSAAITLWAKSLAGANVLALGIGVLFLLLSEVLSWMWFNYPLISKLQAFGLVFLLSPIVAIPVQITMAPLIVAAFRFGWVGWATTLMCGAVAAPLSFYVLDDFVLSWDLFKIGMFLGPCFAAVYWVSSALFTPRPDERATA